MLILTRRPGEGIAVRHDVEIVVMGVEGSHVRIGIRAPRGVRVFRSELLRQVEEENHRAAASSTGGVLSRLATGVTATRPLSEEPGWISD